MAEHEEQDELGRGTGRGGPWSRDDEGARAAKQEGDPDALAVEDDPRGGLQSDAYRRADPRFPVREGGTAMSGPGGAPQDDMPLEERRELGGRRRPDDEPPGAA